MIKETIPLELSNQFPRLVLDYYAQRDDMEPFYEYTPNMDGLRTRIETLKKQNFDRQTLVKVLAGQMEGKVASKAQKANMEYLANGSGYTICTGHQVCLFTGPLYSLHKIASIIALAKKLTNTGGIGIKAIPVFWMATEDHDIEEVDHIHLFGSKLSLDTDYTGPAGKLPLKNIEGLLEEVEQRLGSSENARSAMEMLRSSYREGFSLGEATRELLNELFAQEGLLILDADDIELKKLFIPVMEEELKNQMVTTAIAPTLEMMKSRGEKVQAHPRELNLFYLKGGLRTRIVHDDGMYETVEGDYSWNEDSILDELHSNPERFSPNVLMRPLYQEVILPNIAYIGGPGELSYWLQLKQVFVAAKMRMPMLLLRDSFLWMDARSHDKFTTLGFSTNDLFRSEDSLHKDYALSNSEEEVDVVKEKEALIKQFDRLIDKTGRIDNGLVQFAKAERQKLENAVDTLEKKLVRAEKKKHSDALSRISSTKDRFFPNGGLQERKENFLSFFIQSGRGFITDMIQNADPLETVVKVMITD